MFNYLKSLFNTEKEDTSEKTVESIQTNNIIPNILEKKGIKYSNISSGYQVKLKDDYYLVIPFTIDNNTYFYLQKGLKDRNDNDIKCTYFFKIVEKNNSSDIIFVNRIKILNDNIKCDENYSRISKDILQEISNIVNDIANNIPKKVYTNRKVIEIDMEPDVNQKNVKQENVKQENVKPDVNQPENEGKSKSLIPFVLGATTTAVSAAILMSSDANIMKGGSYDKKEEDEKKYNNLKRLLEESLSESE
jgi:hypothetical protein